MTPLSPEMPQALRLPRPQDTFSKSPARAVPTLLLILTGLSVPALPASTLLTACSTSAVCHSASRVHPSLSLFTSPLLPLLPPFPLVLEGVHHQPL